MDYSCQRSGRTQVCKPGSATFHSHHAILQASHPAKVADQSSPVALAGKVRGGCQVLSRSLLASMIQRHRSAEFLAVFEKIAGIPGRAILTGTIDLTGSSRNAILAVITFFVVGGGLLAFVNVPEGQRLARRAEVHQG